MNPKFKNLPYRSNVGIMLINDDGHVFVGQRLDNNQNAWQMPQGGIDCDEDPQSAAYRELLEETGIEQENVKFLAKSSKWLLYDLPEDLIPRLWDGKYRGQKQKWFLFKFLGTNRDINISTEHPEFSNWKWMPKENLLEEIVPFKKSVYESVLREFERI
ncbi:RNA pyrophosphohydrolase [Paracoccaceae bacterium]|nr:RNA pyrophosphohydrolase [Paracoccaceae bacterium]MDC3205177.1 RNA pyrophosphohydrolase [Paracoccaceae bacterium]